jgi:hypothetical protein
MIALAIPAAAVAIALIVALAALHAWHGWLEFKRLELAARHPLDNASHTGVRIELADVRERLRNLEEIASGVEL